MSFGGFRCSSGPKIETKELVVGFGTVHEGQEKKNFVTGEQRKNEAHPPTPKKDPIIISKKKSKNYQLKSVHNPAPVFENDSHKLLWDFDIHTDHLISARRPDLIIILKKREFVKLSTLQSQLTTEKKLKEFEKSDKYLDLARELKKLWNMKVTIVPIGIGFFWHNNERIIKRPGGLGSWRTGRDYLNDSIMENGQNTEKSPGDLWRCSHSNSSEKLPPNPDVKNSKGVNNNNTYIHTYGSPNLGQKTRPDNNQQNEENLQNCRLCCPG